MPRRRPRRPGRPTKCTPQITGVLIEHVRQGVPFETAAYAAGVHPATAWRWLADGEEQDADTCYREFYEAITRARAGAETDMVAAVIADAKGGAIVKHLHRVWRNGTEENEYQYAPPNGKVALEYLARRHPERWGKQQSLELTGAGGGPVQIEQQVAVIGALADRLHLHLAATTTEHPVVRGELVAGDEAAAS